LRKGSQGRYACRACQKVTIAQGPYEALVEQAVLSRLAKPDAAAVWARPADTAALAAAEADAADLRAALQEHYQQAAMRRLSAQGLAAVEAGLLPQIERAEARVKALSTPSELATIGDPGQIIERWPSLPPVQKRAVVRALIDLVVDPATVKGGRGVDPRRFDRSRWIGDDETWGQAYERQTAARVGADRIEPPAPVKVPTPRRPRHRQPGGTRA
jgi:hypothetical protein